MGAGAAIGAAGAGAAAGTMVGEAGQAAEWEMDELIGYCRVGDG